ncbi:MAG: BREX protein BrxB domain-containing protein [Chloroflexota bacterium]
MSEVDDLLKAYERQVCLPWDNKLSGSEKVWFVVYDPAQERRLRFRMGDFQNTTRQAGHGWLHLDLTDAFATWMAAHRYKESYFETPDDMEPALKDFSEMVVTQINGLLGTAEAGEQDVVAISGLASLFGLTRASAVFEKVTSSIRGRLIVFFPGQHDGSNYRLLDARDGWNYLAIPITSKKGTD